jgi:hypothetical protein
MFFVADQSGQFVNQLKGSGRRAIANCGAREDDAFFAGTPRPVSVRVENQLEPPRQHCPFQLLWRFLLGVSRTYACCKAQRVCKPKAA